ESEYAKGAFTPLLHCYTGGLPLVKSVLSMGGYVAFSGILTFKKADDVRAVAAEIPLDRLLIETDCPFLAPMPHRGKRNEPSFLPHVAQKLAEVKNVDLATIEESTTTTFFNLFTRAKYQP
ncbi:MAG: TatD family hydrolase, partial [Pseudomonadota bacterium]